MSYTFCRLTQGLVKLQLHHRECQKSEAVRCELPDSIAGLGSKYPAPIQEAVVLYALSHSISPIVGIVATSRRNI